MKPQPPASFKRSCGRVARRDVFARSIGILIMVVTVTVTMVVTAAILVLPMVSALVTVTMRIGGDGPPSWRNLQTKRIALDLADLFWQ